MKFVAISIILMIGADLVLTRGTNTAHFFGFVAHFFHAVGDAHGDSIFSK